jgi:hypothetical protein
MMHTQCGPKVLGLIFLKIEDTHFFLIQNKLHWHIYGLLRRRTVSEKLPKIPFFGAFFNSSVTASWISATSAKWSLLISFSTWGTENSQAEINLERRGVKKGCNIFGGVKSWQTLAALWAGALSCNQKKSREQNAAGRTR